MIHYQLLIWKEKISSNVWALWYEVSSHQSKIIYQSPCLVWSEILHGSRLYISSSSIMLCHVISGSMFVFIRKIGIFFELTTFECDSDYSSTYFDISRELTQIAFEHLIQLDQLQTRVASEEIGIVVSHSLSNFIHIFDTPRMNTDVVQPMLRKCGAFVRRIEFDNSQQSLIRLPWSETLLCDKNKLNEIWLTLNTKITYTFDRIRWERKQI